MSASSSDSIRRARLELAVFLGLTFACSWALMAYMIRLGGSTSSQGRLILALMWTPGLVSLLCRALFRVGVRDAGFGLGRHAGLWLAAWFVPLAVGLCAYGAAWATGLVPFQLPKPNSLELARGLASLSPTLRFVSWSGVMLLLGTLMGAISAAGEELGWRGFMTTRLVAAGMPQPLVLGGLIWGLWHLPLILSGQYAAGKYPLVSAAVFMVTITAAGRFAGMLRVRSGSVWPAVIFHASWNAQIQAVFDRFSALDAHPEAALWLGESGLIVCVANLLVLLTLFRALESPRHLGELGTLSPGPLHRARAEQ